jgi:hypothetical protein
MVAIRRLRQEGHKFLASLAYVVRLHLEKLKKKNVQMTLMDE